MTTNCCSTSKEMYELIAPLVEAPTLAALFFYFYNQASSLSLLSATSFFALLRGKGVEFLAGFAGTFLTFFLPFYLYSRSSSSSKVSTSACVFCCVRGRGSMITIPFRFELVLQRLSKNSSAHRLCSNGRFFIFCLG